jgi:D-alanyl-D-alanine carboxypeptidase
VRQFAEAESVDRPQRHDPWLFHLRVYNPQLDATIVIAMNSDKKVNGEQGINVLLRDISKILFPNNPVNVPVIK